jgi:hypothetical protein
MDLSEFEFKFPKHILISSLTGGGKTSIAKEIINNNRKQFNNILVITGSTTDDYNGIIDRNWIVNVNNLKKIQKIIEVQHHIKKKGGNMSMLIIFDDCIGSVNLYSGKFGEMITRLFSNGRHSNISLMIITQLITKVPPLVRENCSYIIVGKSSKKSIETIFQYQTEYDTMDELYSAYKAHTSKPFHFIMIQNVNCNEEQIMFLNSVIKEFQDSSESEDFSEGESDGKSDGKSDDEGEDSGNEFKDNVIEIEQEVVETSEIDDGEVEFQIKD